MNVAKPIVRLAARGDGVTEDGEFVSGAAPGDTVTVTGIVPGPHRSKPPCVHFGTCGGCQLQHVDDETLAGFVAGRIVGALAGIGIVAARVHPAHLSPPHSRRRASLRALNDRNGFRMGFNVEESNAVVDLHECHVVTPALWSAIVALRPVLPGLLMRGRAAGVTLTQTASGIDCVLANIDAGVQVSQSLSDFAAANRVARISLGGPAGTEIAVHNDDAVVRFDGIAVVLPPGGFLQATADGERALQAAVSGICGPVRRIADLFCGVGTFALPLSRTSQVLAADAAGPAVAALGVASRLAGRRIEAVHRDLFRHPLTAGELARYDAVVLDPPRAGAKAQIAELAMSKVERIAYVSCNPNTFARDAKLLVDAGYRLTELWPIGQFRWSVHVELVAGFCRSDTV